MMEFKQIVQNFKAIHVQDGKTLNLSLLPLLMRELVQNGLNITHTDGKFYQDLAAEIFDNHTKEMQIDVVDALFVVAQIVPNPKKDYKTITNPKVGKMEAIIENDIIRTDHLVANIPHEDDEGDPLHTPPEDIIHLRPEDCEPMHVDHEFMALVGAKGYEK